MDFLLQPRWSERRIRNPRGTGSPVHAGSGFQRRHRRNLPDAAARPAGGRSGAGAVLHGRVHRPLVSVELPRNPGPGGARAAAAGLYAMSYYAGGSVGSALSGHFRNRCGCPVRVASVQVLGSPLSPAHSKACKHRGPPRLPRGLSPPPPWLVRKPCRCTIRAVLTIVTAVVFRKPAAARTLRSRARAVRIPGGAPSC